MWELSSLLDEIWDTYINQVIVLKITMMYLAGLIMYVYWCSQVFLGCNELFHRRKNCVLWISGLVLTSLVNIWRHDAGLKPVLLFFLLFIFFFFLFGLSLYGTAMPFMILSLMRWKMFEWSLHPLLSNLVISLSYVSRHLVGISHLLYNIWHL